MIGVITGFKKEAELLPEGFGVVCSGGDSLRARWQARLLLDGGASGLLSFGIAGGLEPGLAPGTLVVATAVVTDGGREFACHPGWSSSLLERLPEARGGLVAASPRVVASFEAKRALYDRCRALAVDMESGAVAEECRRAEMPFAVLRAIADPAERGVPGPALAGLDGQGEILVKTVILDILRHPGSLPGMVRLGCDSRAALKALADAVTRFGLGGAEGF